MRIIPDPLPRTSGIYKIACLPTGKIYVGSASNLRKRQRDHYLGLERHIHNNIYLQHAWNKYGADAFTFTVIELVLSPFLIEREQYWFNKLRPYDHSVGYNICPTAGSCLGVVHSDETRKRWSAMRKGRHVPAWVGSLISRAKTGTKYKPHSESARRAKSIRQQGHTISDETKAKIGAANRGRKPPESTRRAQIAAISKAWIVTDPNGIEYAIVNLEAFCREHGLTAVCMGAVASGKAKYHKGWKCRRST